MDEDLTDDVDIKTLLSTALVAAEAVNNAQANYVQVVGGSSSGGLPWNGNPPFTAPYPGGGTITVSDPYLYTQPECAICEVEHLTVYSDGAFGDCKVCNRRVKVEIVPGGLQALKARDFLERVVSASDEEDQGELLSKMSGLEVLLKAEEAEIELAKGMLALAKKMLMDGVDIDAE